MKLKLLKISSLITALLVNIPGTLAQATEPPIPEGVFFTLIKSVGILLFKVDPLTMNWINFAVWYLLTWVMVFAIVYDILSLMTGFRRVTAIIASFSITVMGVHLGMLEQMTKRLQGWILPAYGWGLIFILAAALVTFVLSHLKAWWKLKKGIDEMKSGIKTLKEVGRETTET